jgi:prepilin-type N-terminal cleavage/methylation domain-containing protein
MQWAKTQKGFTIVELLIVIVVIAILAAITIVAYNGIQDRAKASAAQSAAAQAAKKVALYAVEHNDQYPTLEQLSEAGITDMGGLQYSGGGAIFCITATKQNVSYFQRQTGAAARGACDGHSKDGVPTITNLVLNPKLAVGTSGWSAIQSTNGASTGGRISGLSSLDQIGVTTAYRTTLTAVPDSWWRVQYAQAVPVTAGQAYTLSGYIRPSTSLTTSVIIIWLNSSNSTITESGASAGHTAGNWQRRSVTATAPTGAVNARFHFGATGGGTVGATLDATAAMFTQTSSAPVYADGDTSSWAWTGTPNASTSTGIPL